jgi:hypothetical protein
LTVDRNIRWLVRLENAALAALAIVLFAAASGNWWLFAALILAPDLAFLGYLKGPKTGALAYNAVHTWLAPALLAAVSLAGVGPVPAEIGLIWAAHIGIDRALGYGLKLPAGFNQTHLGPIGRAKSPPGAP